jgi:hypothetical protein
MAKKVRTPPPPRRAVQAPQRRDPRKAAGGPPGRSPWLYAAAGVVVAALAAAIIGFVVLGDDDGGASETRTTASYNSLPGIRTTMAPWPPEYAFLADRLLPLGLSQLPEEQLAFHIHQHVDLFVDGKEVAVPANIGIVAGAYITELHTHDTRGVIHVESAETKDYTLGQFFGEWGVRLDSRCLGSYCNGLKWYVNGVQQAGNPAGLVLKNHQQIAIVVGKPPKTIPSSYDWRRGE